MDTGQSRQEPDHILAVERILGFVLLFVGFIPVLLSLSSPMFEVGITPFLMFIAGIIFTVHSVFSHWSRWIVIGIAVFLDIAILVNGEVVLWHKQILFFIAAVGGIYAFVSTDKKENR
tara:strand:- start:202 stop:555 length:354 start_codon:yes stop_codon:yes gene_type:complete